MTSQGSKTSEEHCGIYTHWPKHCQVPCDCTGPLNSEASETEMTNFIFFKLQILCNEEHVFCHNLILIDALKYMEILVE